MTEIAERIMSELAQLSVPERAALANFLIRSLDESEELGADAAWDVELARRAEEIETGNAVGEPATEVFTGLREKYS